MKGILLAGGTGSRLLPMTRVTNKHLLGVFDRPMIYWPLQVLRDNDITDIMVVSGRDHMGDIFRLLGSGAEFGCKFTYRVQDEAGGIAEALNLAAGWADGDVAVVLGDNMFDPTPEIRYDWQLAKYNGAGAMVYATKVDRPEAYGVATFDPNESFKVLRIDEKPEQPATRWAVTGLYVYAPGVFDRIPLLRRSGRGEMEITDLNMTYAREGRLFGRIHTGFWGDCGTPTGILRAAVYAEQSQRVLV